MAYHKYISKNELEQRFQRHIRTIRRWEKTRNFPPPVLQGVGAENLWLREQVELWEENLALATSWNPKLKSKVG